MGYEIKIDRTTSALIINDKGEVDILRAKYGPDEVLPGHLLTVIALANLLKPENAEMMAAIIERQLDEVPLQ